MQYLPRYEVQYVVFIPPLHPAPPPPAHRCNNPYCLTVYCSISSLNYNVAPRKIMFFTVRYIQYIAIGSIGSRLFPLGHCTGIGGLALPP